MYSEIKNVQILVALLKEYGLNQVVMAPGGSDIPIIHSIEQDSFFQCYSIVDERSLVYFAMGLAQESQKPVVCLCTSGTAACNFLPGITEAYYQDVPIVAITADKNPYRLNQLETQKIDQTNIFQGVCKKSVNLPVVINTEQEWYCGRLINEALIELNHHGTGPVHINIPVMGKIYVYDVPKLPAVKKISLLSKESDKALWKEKEKILKLRKRIFIIVGQNIYFSKDDILNIEKFFDSYNCVISVEHLSNLNCRGTVKTYPITEACDRELFASFCPDLVISLGNNIVSASLKPSIRNCSRDCEHWQIDPAGRVRDMFDCLTTVFECTISEFFQFFTSEVTTQSDKKYYNLWKETLSMLQFPETGFTDFFVVKKIAEVLPKHSLLHVAILNSTRLFQFFDLPKNIKFYSNVGGLGIDGCLSTFMGQAAQYEGMSFCVLGDLSYFYDMNASGIRYLHKNIRIILLNNKGGGEFHYLVGKDNISTLNNYISAEHKKTAVGWMNSLGFDCCVVETEKELEVALDKIIKPSEKPLFVEVCTDMEKDAEAIKSFYKKTRSILGGKKAVMKDAVRSILGNEGTQKLKKILGK